jgi:flagellar biosynthesis/type III secretory pathway M-ring protein FliF/YscJ
MSTFLTAIAWGFGIIAGLALGVIVIKALMVIAALPRELALQRRRRENAKARIEAAKQWEEDRQAKADALLLENSELAEVVAELTALKEQPSKRGTGHIRERQLRKLRKLVPDEKIRRVFHERTRRAG